MISKIHPLLVDVYERWRLGLVTGTMVAGLLTLGLLMRTPFMADATVEIGGVTQVENGLVSFLRFEEANEIEAFFSHHVFTLSSPSADGHCRARAMYSPDGLRLKMSCGGNSENQARKRTLSALQPLLDRHARYYELAQKDYEQRQQHIERQIRGAERMIEALRNSLASGFSEAQIIKHQLDIEELREREAFERLLGNRIRPTQFDVESISVVNRQPGLGVWAAVLFLGLGSGMFVAVFAARLKRIEHE